MYMSSYHFYMTCFDFSTSDFPYIANCSSPESYPHTSRQLKLGVSQALSSFLLYVTLLSPSFQTYQPNTTNR